MLLHKTYKGILHRTGVSTMFESVSKYSVLQVDKEIITNVRISDKLDSFLDVGEYVELTVTRMPMTFLKFVVVLKSNKIVMKDKSFVLFVVWLLFAAPLYFIIKGDNFHLNTLMCVYIGVLAFELWNFLSALNK